MSRLNALPFDNSFARLPSEFFSRVQPRGFARPHLVAANPRVAELLDIDPAELASPDFPRYFGGQLPLPGSDPLAMKYTGHQFGVYNPELGDGRGLLLGEMVNGKGQRWDLHLKGAGPTPYSRFGDGRAVLRSCIREYLGGEAMHGLGIASTRALCIIGSDEPVQREKTETGAMLLRVADSHIRFGHFEWLFHSGQHELLKTLADYVIDRHYPEFAEADKPYQRFFAEVVRRTAVLIVDWQLAGFAHGVMNTDNFSITGATFDYGPFGFLDAYEPGYICNHSDHHGRYAWNQQPSIALWNLNALAHALSGLIDRDALVEILQGFEGILVADYARKLRGKFGLRQEEEDDRQLTLDFLDLMMKNQTDFTRTFRTLSDVTVAGGHPALRDDFLDREGFDAWLLRYRERLARENSQDAERKAAMDRVNPRYILRNYLAQVAIDKAEAGDFSEIEKLRQLLEKPFDEQPENAGYAALPPDWGRHMEISCSS
ncbi:MAG TPA: YdiU family protein [Moraxellaceae bacterium]